MGAKRKCVGCGAIYDFVFGETYICPYCGTKQNSSLSKDALKYIESAENYRRNKDFKKAIAEYEKALKINPDLSDVNFGIFLATYKICNENELYLNYEIDNKESVLKNEKFKLAIENGGSNSKKWFELGNSIEKQRILINKLRKSILNNKYLAVLVVDESSPEDKKVADNLYCHLQDKFNILYPPHSFSKLADEYKSVALNISISEIHLVFIIQSTYTNNKATINLICDEFISNWEDAYLYVISDDFDQISSDMEESRMNIDLDYDANDLSEKILNEVILVADLSFEERLKLKKERKLPKDSSFNSIISIKEN